MASHAVNDDPLRGHDRYRSVRQLGQGAMGLVLEAEHVLLGTRVVVKVLHDNLSSQPTLIDRMRLEARALAQMSHPNLVRVTDFDQTSDGRPFFVMELLHGRSLREEAAERGRIPALEALAICRQALAGLGAAHEAGLIHRDVKLDNIFVCDAVRPGAERSVKVLDFGVAKVRAKSGVSPAVLLIPTATGVVVGTPRFFSPEQASGAPVDHRADIYSLGLVLYTLLAGRGPFDDALNVTDMARAHVFQQPAPPSSFVERGITPELDAAVMKAIEKRPEDRFASAEAFAAELEAIARRIDRGTQPMAARAPAAARQPPKWNGTEVIAPEGIDEVRRATAATRRPSAAPAPVATPMPSDATRHALPVHAAYVASGPPAPTAIDASHPPSPGRAPPAPTALDAATLGSPAPARHPAAGPPPTSTPTPMRSSAPPAHDGRGSVPPSGPAARGRVGPTAQMLPGPGPLPPTESMSLPSRPPPAPAPGGLPLRTVVLIVLIALGIGAAIAFAALRGG